MIVISDYDYVVMATSQDNEMDLERDASRNIIVYTIDRKCVASCAFRRLFFKSAPQATCPPKWEKCHRNSGIRTQKRLRS